MDEEAEAAQAIESVLIEADATGLTVHWSDCSRCGKPRDEHGPGLLCPRD